MYVYKELLFPKVLTALSHPFLSPDVKHVYLPSDPFHTQQWGLQACSWGAGGPPAQTREGQWDAT